MDYLLHILIILNIYIVLTVSSNLLIGLSNLLSLCQAAFYGIGAYLTALALIKLDLPLIIALLFAALLTVIVAFLIARLSIKFEGDFFVLVTLGFQIIIYSVLYNWIDVTRGPYGIPGIPSPKLFALFEVSDTIHFLILSSILSIITIFVFERLMNSPFGRILRALKDDALAATALGKNVNQYKMYTFVFAAFFAAISGFVYATYITYIDPTSFNLDESIFIVTAILIGGTGNIKGPVLGALFVVLLPEVLRFVGFRDSIAANLRMIIYGLCLILLMFYKPEGIAGKIKVQ